MDPNTGLYLTMVALGLTILGTAVKLTWNVRQIDKDIREDLREYMDAQLENIQRDTKEVERGSLDRADTLRQQTGEMGAALRTKIHEVEVYMRDMYVPKENFEFFVSRMEGLVEKMTDKLEAKIDRAVERFQRSQ